MTAAKKPSPEQVIRESLTAMLDHELGLTIAQLSLLPRRQDGLKAKLEGAGSLFDSTVDAIFGFDAAVEQYRAELEAARRRLDEAGVLEFPVSEDVAS